MSLREDIELARRELSYLCQENADGLIELHFKGGSYTHVMFDCLSPLGDERDPVAVDAKQQDVLIHAQQRVMTLSSSGLTGCVYIRVAAGEVQPVRERIFKNSAQGRKAS